MAAIADGIDYLSEHFLFARGTSTVAKDYTGEKAATSVVYLGFGFLWFVIFGRFSSLDFSALVTCAAFVQCFGLTLLSMKVYATKSLRGLSSKMLVMFVLHYGFRLSSTSIKNGYVPVDKSGDYMYQLLDFTSLLLCLHLLFAMHKTYRHTYQEEYDTLPLTPLVAMCIVLGICIHGTFNMSFLFDSIWQISANLETFVLVPQLWMLARMGGKVDTVTAHFVFCMVASGVMTFTFWSWTAVELEKRGANFARHLNLGFHALKLLLGADFMYYYAQAWLGGTDVILPSMDGVEM